MISTKESLTPLQRELLDRADSIFAAMKDAAIVAKDFALEQLPDVAQQLILLERVHLSIIFLLPFLFLLILVLGLRYCDKSEDSPRTNFVAFIEAVTFVSVVATLFSLVGMLLKFRDFLVVWFAPKIYLIEYLTALIKKTV